MRFETSRATLLFSSPTPALLNLTLPSLSLSLSGALTERHHRFQLQLLCYSIIVISNVIISVTSENAVKQREKERERERQRVSERECERESVCLLLPMHLRSSTHSVASSSVCLSHCLRASGHAALPTRRRCTVAEIALLCAHFFKY